MDHHQPHQLQKTRRQLRIERQQRRRRLFTATAIVLVGFFGIQIFRTLSRNHSKAVAERAAEVDKKAAEIARQAALAKQAELRQKITDIIAQYPDLQIGVTVADITNNISDTIGVDAKYEAASISKLITATLFLHQVEQGTYSIRTPINGDTAQNQLERLIVDSDNNAWEAFNIKLKRPALEAWAKSNGLNSYTAKTNTVSVTDIGTLLSKLQRREILNEEHTALLLSYMSRANYRDYIISAIPDGVKAYHKAGVLDDRILDAAIIDGGQPYALVIFTKADGAYDNATEIEVFQAITNATLPYFGIKTDA